MGVRKKNERGRLCTGNAFEESACVCISLEQIRHEIPHTKIMALQNGRRRHYEIQSGSYRTLSNFAR